MNGAALPTKAAGVLQERGRPDIALRLLRQHRPPGPAAPLEEACVALGARLANGLLVEGYMVLSEHLATVAPAERPRHATVLLGQLLDWAAQLRSVNTVIRLHFTEEEESAVAAWLERAAVGGHSQAGLLLSLFHLMRGRVPEALLAYNRLCPAARASTEQAQVLELLRSTASMLPPAQRALVVRQGSAPALLVGEDSDETCGEMEMGDTGALLARLPELVVEDMPRLVAVGPDEARAPLVGSVPVLVNGSQAETVAATSAGERAAECSNALAAVSATGPLSPRAVEPMLFGQDAVAAAREAAAAAAPLPDLFSQPAAAAPPPAVDRSGLLSGVVDFDAVLFGSAGKRRRPGLHA